MYFDESSRDEIYSFEIFHVNAIARTYVYIYIYFDNSSRVIELEFRIYMTGGINSRYERMKAELCERRFGSYRARARAPAAGTLSRAL